MKARTITLHLTTGATEDMTDEEVADEVMTILELCEDTPLAVVGITLPWEEN